MKILGYLCLCFSLNTHAQVYQWRDANGGQHFADQAVSENATTIALTPRLASSAGNAHFYRVKTVYDGDTVQLEDGQKIRFLGINTPEVDHHGNAAQAGGAEAKQWLSVKLHNTRVRLENSAEKTDKYGRTLAHLFTEQNEHLNVQLVEAGLASVAIFPPNLLYAAELVAAEQHAEQAKRGIWQHPQYAPIPANQLNDSVYAQHQWQRVIGTVRALYPTKSAVYLQFTDNFAARIDRDNVALFPDLQRYVGKTLEVRGWLAKNRGRFSMLIRHPSAMR